MPDARGRTGALEPAPVCAEWGHLMGTPEPRYLRFDHIDIKLRRVSGECSRCGQHFSVVPKPKEYIESVARRVQAKFDLHVCNAE